MNLRKILFVLVPVFAFVLVACDDGLGSYSGDEIYTNEAHGFEIAPPEGWVDGDDELGNNIVSFVSVDGDTDSGSEPFHANIGVLSESAQGLSFDEYVELSMEATQDAIPGLEFMGEEDVEVNGLPAQLVTSKFQNDGVGVVTVQLMTLKEEEMYIVTGASLESAWGKNKNVIRESLESFTFN